MRKRGPAIIVCTLILGLLGLAVVLREKPTPDPVYKGRRLSDWLVVLCDSDNKTNRAEAAEVVCSIGTNGFPLLLQMLETEESPTKSKLLAWRWYHFFALLHFWEPSDAVARAYAGFYALGTNAVAAVPGLAKVLDDNKSEESVNRAAEILGRVGPEAKDAVLALLRAAKNPQRNEHDRIIKSLGLIHAEPQTVVPFLADLVRGGSRDQMAAVIALGKFGRDASAAEPELMKLLSDPKITTNTPGTGFISDREQVERALEQIDPTNYSQTVISTPIHPSN